MLSHSIISSLPPAAAAHAPSMSVAPASSAEISAVRRRSSGLLVLQVSL